MPTIYNYYNPSNSTYKFSILNKPQDTYNETYFTIGDDETQIYTTSSGNLNIKANLLTIDESATIEGNLKIGNNYLYVTSVNNVGYTGINNSSPTKNLDVIGDARIKDGDLTVSKVIEDVENVLFKVDKSNGNITSDGNLTIDGGITSKGNIIVDSENNKFTVNATTGNTYVKGDLTVDGNLLGRVPLGGIIAICPVFSGINNSGSPTYKNFPSSGVIDSEGFQLCDGVIIGSGAYSSFVSRYVPDLTDNRFIRGSGIGGIGGVGGADSITIAMSNLPQHTHTMGDHTHTINHGHTANTNAITNTSFGNLIEGGSGYTPPTKASASVSVVDFTGSSGNPTSSSTGNGGFSNTSISIIPRYINVVYMMRVK